MTIDTLAVFVTTPEFYAGLVTGALVSKVVQAVVGDFIERHYGTGDGGKTDGQA